MSLYYDQLVTYEIREVQWEYMMLDIETEGLFFAVLMPEQVAWLKTIKIWEDRPVFDVLDYRIPNLGPVQTKCFDYLWNVYKNLYRFI